jgi:hypothetical protein
MVLHINMYLCLNHIIFVNILTTSSKHSVFLLVKRSFLFLFKHLFDKFSYFSFEQKLDMSSCQNVTHVGLSSVFSCTRCLEQLTLAYGSSVSLYNSLGLSDSRSFIILAHY